LRWRAGTLEARRMAMEKRFLSHACEVSCRIRAEEWPYRE
jgi:hypothetical protein